MSDLFDTGTIGSKHVRNRVVFPPVVTFWAGTDGVVTDDHVQHYRRRAQGECGLIIVEATCVAPDGRLSPKQLGLWSDSQTAGIARIVKACKSAGATVLIQIHHAGYKTPSEVSTSPVAPSDYNSTSQSARALRFEEISGIRRQFVAAARRAAEAGADGVEIHAAHGYLLNQFASPIVNMRRDRYGWDLPGRMRLITEIIKQIREETRGTGFVIGCRIGCNEPTFQDGIAVGRYLEKIGVDVLHVSAGIGYNRPADTPEVPDGFEHSWIVWGGIQIRKYIDIPVIAVNGIRRPSEARALVRSNVDFVALARAQLVDPAWASKARKGESPVTCLECRPKCKWFQDGRTCPRFDEEWLAPQT